MEEGQHAHMKDAPTYRTREEFAVNTEASPKKYAHTWGVRIKVGTRDCANATNPPSASRRNAVARDVIISP